MTARWPAWLLWASFATVVAVLAAVLLQACGLAASRSGPNFCPVAPAALSAEAERSDRLRAEIARLQLDLTGRSLECAMVPPAPVPELELPTEAGPPRPQQVAEVKPPPPPKPPPKPLPPLPADRWAKKDVGLLDGCWQLGRETATTVDGASCVVKAGRICFQSGGSGERQMNSQCPSRAVRCSAPVRAAFGNDGSLNLTQSDAPCDQKGVTWWGDKASLKCRRVNDTLALCRNSLGYEHEFRRMRS